MISPAARATSATPPDADRLLALIRQLEPLALPRCKVGMIEERADVPVDRAAEAVKSAMAGRLRQAALTRMGLTLFRLQVVDAVCKVALVAAQWAAGEVFESEEFLRRADAEACAWLLAEFREAMTVEVEVDTQLPRFLENRNRFLHGQFVTAGVESLDDPVELDAASRFLQEFEVEMQRAQEVFVAYTAAVARQSLGGAAALRAGRILEALGTPPAQ